MEKAKDTMLQNINSPQFDLYIHCNPIKIPEILEIEALKYK